MNCKNCSALRWHPNKGFYCTVPDCKPETSARDAREIYERTYGTTTICPNCGADMRKGGE